MPLDGIENSQTVGARAGVVVRSLVPERRASALVDKLVDLSSELDIGEAI
jgi:hypothetical protein